MGFYFLVIFTIMRKKMGIQEKKKKFTISLNPDLSNILDSHKQNRSKYIERLIYLDLLKNKLIGKDFIL